MRSRILAASTVALLALSYIPFESASAQSPTPTPTPTPTPDQYQWVQLGPDTNEVDIYFTGAIAFFPIDKDIRNGVRSVFLVPGHKPYVSIATASIVSWDLEPSFITSGALGYGLAVFELKTIKLDSTNIEETRFGFNGAELSDKEKYWYEGMDPTKLRFAPFVADILADKAGRPPTNSAKAAKVFGEWNYGQLYPVFLKDSIGKQKWEIGKRTAPIADGVRLRLTLVNVGDPLTLMINDKSIVIKGGSTVQISAYPATLPPAKERKMIPHFKHLWELADGGGTIDPPKCLDCPPTPDPARCPPLLLFPVP